MSGPILTLALAALAQGPALSDPVGMLLTLDAGAGTAYAVKCHVRTYKTREGVLANTYTIVNKGPYKDAVPSPNAQCQLWKTGGPGPVTLHIYKAGDHAVTAAEVGKPVPLQVW